MSPLLRVQGRGTTEDGAADPQARQIKTAALNKILREIQAADRPSGDTSRIQVFREDGASASQASDPAIEFVGLQETILASLHVLDENSADWSGWRARMRVDIHIEYYSVTFILDRCTLQAALERSPETPAPAEATREYVSKWYRKIWTEFFDLLASKGVTLDHLARGHFFDTRGLVLDTAPPAVPLSKRARFPILDERIFANIRNESKTALRSWVDQHGDVMSRILRLDRSAGKDQDANCVLCYVMNGRGIYATSMGRSEAELRSKRGGSAEATPERYLLLHHGLPRFQVGRVLRRLHVLDELRCATTFNLDELVVASKSIRETGDNISRQLGNSRDGLTRQVLETIQHELNRLTSSQQIGGLTYRINRSRSYARNFKLGMEDLRFAPIKGWEPYDAFMHRSLFPTIDHIDGIGQRFEALSSRVERLTEQRDVAESINVQNRIADIQQIGEIIGWTAFAYYGGQILEKFLPAGPASCPFCEIIDICQITHEHVGTVVSTLFAIAAYLYFRRQRLKND